MGSFMKNTVGSRTKILATFSKIKVYSFLAKKMGWATFWEFFTNSFGHPARQLYIIESFLF
jgi:hypothetical protein